MTAPPDCAPITLQLNTDERNKLQHCAVYLRLVLSQRSQHVTTCECPLAKDS